MAVAAKLEQCILAAGKPPSASATCSSVRLSASSSVLPLIMVEAIELEAMAAPQPNVRNLMSSMTPSEMRR